VVSSIVKHEFSCPLAFDCLCYCCGLIRRMGHSGAYITLYMIKIMFSLLSWCILSCAVPLPRAVRPLSMPFKMVFCIGVGWCRKSSMHGVTQHNALIMACDVYFVHTFVAISTDTLNSSLFCKLDRFCRGKSSWSSDAASC
jgi:hypothetical protein